ncbi:MAG TPA: tetratricopeptide repeat protein [Pyrinomonadaceae bacterium]|nr:tetratricopeptide repeat protein [Pyrinomonadaceae bacterium]
MLQDQLNDLLPPLSEADASISQQFPILSFKWMSFKSKPLLAFSLFFAAVVCGQTGTGSIHGNVLKPDGSPVTDAVKVTLKVMRGDQQIAYTDQEGRFELLNVTQGEYTIEADSDRERRFDPGNERVQVRRGAASVVTIYLRQKPADQQSIREKSISVGMLDQRVPSAAKKEFEKASRFSAEGDSSEAIAALKRALAIYPDYLAAHNDLGAQLLEQGKFAEAEFQLQAAVKIDPKAFNPQLNLGIVLLKQNKFSEALAALDKALSIEPAAPAVHLYAGLASLKLDDTARGEKELNAAYNLGGSPYAVALLHLGRLYMKRGERELALKSFESYLRETPNAPDANQVEKLIAMLR